ncbi:MAG: hypothetical protein SH847_02270 [Roseiflexaceae bacterium]|nr:hypothetical protein [Roseiflexaceae bacterium]
MADSIALGYNHLRENDLVRRGIGRKFQTPTVFTSLTVAQNIEVMLGLL